MPSKRSRGSSTRPALQALGQALVPFSERLAEARAALRRLDAPEGLGPLGDELETAAACVASALDAFVHPGAGVQGILRAFSDRCRAMEHLYPLRLALPPVNAWFVEPPFRNDLAALDANHSGEAPGGAAPPVGLLESRGSPRRSRGLPPLRAGVLRRRGDWPLVVALHGGSGDGRDFLWTWLREARGRRFLLLAPTSRGPTWSLNGPDLDADALQSMVAFVQERWRVDADRVLLTGLSDGATYSLLCGLREGAPYTHIAPLSGVLHPRNLSNGNLERAADRSIYLVHGALDWMFPVAIARAARDELERAGARLVYREIEDLSHTYAREENDAILAWFDPRMALPRSPGGLPS